MAHLKLLNISTSTTTTKILEQAKKNLGFVPNMYVTMGANPALLDSYIYSYNSFRANSGFTSAEQEVVFLTIAYENNCEYCMAAHSFIADKMSKVPTEITDAIRDGKQIQDLKFGALSKLTRSLVVNKGNVPQAEIDEFLTAGYAEFHVLGIIAGIAAKTMSNYSNHITNPEIDAAFAERIWKK